MAGGVAQIWPATPVAAPLIENRKVVGVRLADQGVDKKGAPEAAYMPGLDVRAPLTVVGDGRSARSAGPSTGRAACPKAITSATSP